MASPLQRAHLSEWGLGICYLKFHTLMNRLSTEAEMETGPAIPALEPCANCAQCWAVVQVSKVKADVKVGARLAVLQTS